MTKIASVLAAMALGCSAALADGRSIVIQGTQVYGELNEAGDSMTFSNACGSQTLSHRALGAGAIPSDIIPCPRPGSTARDDDRERSASERKSYHASAVTSFKRALIEMNGGMFPSALTSLAEVRRNLQLAGETEGLEQVDRAEETVRRMQAVTATDVQCPSGSCDKEWTSWTPKSPLNKGPQTITLTPTSDPNGAVHPVVQVKPGEGLWRENGEVAAREYDGGKSDDIIRNKRCVAKNPTGWVDLGCENLRQWDSMNDAYKNYMRSFNKNSGGRNDGDLTIGSDGKLAIGETR